MELNETSLRKWISKFNNGDFNKSDFDTQCNAGWYDWFCDDDELKDKTYYMGNIVKELKDSSKLNLDKQYVWFKNNCPLYGDLYDDFRIADIKTGDVIYNINIFPPVERYGDYKFCVFGEGSWDKPIFKANSNYELIQWLTA
jgi:hypothetical protein